MTRRGWLYDVANSRGGIFIEDTEVVRFDDATNNIQILGTAGQTIDAGGLTITAGGATITAGGLTVTAGGATITGGNLTTTAGDNRVTAGNVRLGVVSTFGTTEPTSWVVFKSGTQPAGAIATSGGVGADDTTVQKIIAAGTINNVET
jgi:hypothetical protein